MPYAFALVIERDEDGTYLATGPAWQGCHTAADTEEEALELIEDAIRLHSEASLASGEPIPQDVDSARICVAV